MPKFIGFCKECKSTYPENSCGYAPNNMCPRVQQHDTCESCSYSIVCKERDKIINTPNICFKFKQQL